MARIPETTVNKIRESTNILDVISQYVQLKKSGKNWFGLCPFQAEKTPSFSVAPDKQIFHCFSCGRGGNVFNFLMDLKHISFPEAVREVAQQQNIDIPQQDLKTPPIDPQTQQRKHLIQLYDEVARLYHHVLMNTEVGSPALDYLHHRGLTDQVINTYNLGYAPQGILVPFLKQRKLDYQQIRSTGLVAERRDGELSDRFFKRVMFPIRNAQGHTIAFSGRAMDSQNQAKYLNSPETLIFNKGRTIFNYDLAKSAIKNAGNVILFEGFMDVISAFQSGVENGIASMGTSLTTGQIKDIEHITDQLYVCYDGDEPGQKAINRALNLLDQNSNLKLGVIQMPSGIDPDEYRKNNGETKFKQFIHNHRETAVEFKLRFLQRNLNLNNDEDRLNYVEQALKVVASLNSPLERDYYVKKLAQNFDLDRSTLNSQLAGLVNNYVSHKQRQPPHFEVNLPDDYAHEKQHYSQVEQAERCLLWRMLHDRDTWLSISGIENFHFYNVHYQLLYMLAGEYFKGHDQYDPQLFGNFVHNKQYQQWIMSLEQVDIPEQSSNQELGDYVNIIMYIAPLTNQIKKLEAQLKTASKIGDLDRQVQLGSDLIKMKGRLNQQLHTEIKI